MTLYQAVWFIDDGATSIRVDGDKRMVYITYPNKTVMVPYA